MLWSHSGRSCYGNRDEAQRETALSWLVEFLILPYTYYCSVIYLNATIAFETIMQWISKAGVRYIYNPELPLEKNSINWTVQIYLELSYPTKKPSSLLNRLVTNSRSKIEFELEKAHQESDNPIILIGGDLNNRVRNGDGIKEHQLQYSVVFSIYHSFSCRFKPEKPLVHRKWKIWSRRSSSYTFFGKQGKSVIDLVLCNDMSLFSISDLSLKNIATKSDHFQVSFVLNLEIEQIGECNKLKWIESKIRCQLHWQ